jgi:predicted permease
VEALALLALGVALARTSLLPQDTAPVLNQVVLYVCLPAAVLRYVPGLQLDPSLLGLALVPWLLMGVVWALVTLAGWLWGLSREMQGALLLCVGMCNSSFLGYPMVRALLGEAAVPYAVVYDQFGSFLLLSTVGPYVLARYGEGEAPALSSLLAQMARFPAIWALLLALTVFPPSAPLWVQGVLRSLSDAMLPMVMLAVGMSIRLHLGREERGPLVAGLLLRLGLLPALAVPLSWALGLSGPMLQACVLESAMPSMVSAAALAMARGLQPRLCAALVGYGIVLAMVTLPAWAWLLTR